jgi:hypothetical protein
VGRHATVSCENEQVDFKGDIVLEWTVEFWLQKLLDTAIRALHGELADAVGSAYDQSGRPKWLCGIIAQFGLTAVCIQWKKEVDTAFKRLEEGSKNAVKDYNHKQNQQLENLISII